jgi:hypothetical protein
MSRVRALLATTVAAGLACAALAGTASAARQVYQGYDCYWTPNAVNYTFHTFQSLAVISDSGSYSTCTFNYASGIVNTPFVEGGHCQFNDHVFATALFIAGRRSAFLICLG